MGKTTQSIGTRIIIICLTLFIVHAMRIGMYIRTISRKNKGGSSVTYVQLAHNLWDPQSRCAKAQVLHTFGRTDELDTDALKRLAKSINRFLSPEDALQGNASVE